MATSARSTTTRPPSAGEVASALHTVVGSLVRRLKRLPSPSGLTIPEAAALAKLDRRGPLSASELARIEQISPQSMGVTLAGLEAKGCIIRTPDPNDGRRSVVALTPHGRRALNHRRDERTSSLADAIATELTADERAELLRVVPLIERLAQHL